MSVITVITIGRPGRVRPVHSYPGCYAFRVGLTRPGWLDALLYSMYLVFVIFLLSEISKTKVS